MTRKWVLAENKLFATLGTNIGKMYVKPEEISEDIRKELRLSEYKWVEILLSDTIWFIRDLPPNLIEAFRSTLEDSIESDLLLHVVDSNDPKIDEKIKVVDDILSNIWAVQPKVYVFNKTDLLENLDDIKNRFSDLDGVFVSSYKKSGLGDLRKRILEGIGE